MPVAGCRVPEPGTPARLFLTGLTWTFGQTDAVERSRDRSPSPTSVKELGASWFERASRRPDVLPDRAPRCVTSSTQYREEEIAMDHSSASLPAQDGPPSCDAPDPSPTSVTELGASWFERASRRPDVLPDRAPRCVTSSTQYREEEIAMDHSSASLPAQDGPPSCDAPDPSPTSVTELGASWFERASRRPDVLPDRAPRCVTSSTQYREEEIAMDHSSASLPAQDGPPSCDAPDPSPTSVTELGASWFERASRRPDVLPDRAPRCVTSSTQYREEEIAMDHSSASLPAQDGPPSCDAVVPMQGLAGLVCGRSGGSSPVHRTRGAP